MTATALAAITAHGPDGAFEIRAGLVVATDGRHSTMRDAAGLRVIDRGAPMDVLWLRLSRRDSDPAQTLGRVGWRPHPGDAGPRRLLAVRLRHRQGRLRLRCATAGLRVPHGIRARGAAFPRPRARNRLLGRRETADRRGEPAGAVVPARSAADRRCRACHVADRRSRHQPCGAGCGGGGQHPGATRCVREALRWRTCARCSAAANCPRG